MTNGHSLLETTAKRKQKHYSQATIRSISQSDVQQFFLWYNDSIIEFSNGRFIFTDDKEEPFIVYPNLCYNPYTGESYDIITVLVDQLKHSYNDALYLLNYFYFKVSKKPLQQELIDMSNQSYQNRLPQGSNAKLNLDSIISESQFDHVDQKALAYRRTIAVLCDMRNIDKDIVLNFIKQRFLMLDQNNNLCFIAYRDPLEKKEVITITKRGTVSLPKGQRFCKNIIKEHNEGFFYARKEELAAQVYDTLYIFESAIDLMSFLTLVKAERLTLSSEHYCCAALNGAGNTRFIVKLLGRYATIEQVVLCLDNDVKGGEGTDKAKDLIVSQHPTVSVKDGRTILREANKKYGGSFKDFNDLLQIRGESVLGLL